MAIAYIGIDIGRYFAVSAVDEEQNILVIKNWKLAKYKGVKRNIEMVKCVRDIKKTLRGMGYTKFIALSEEPVYVRNKNTLLVLAKMAGVLEYALTKMGIEALSVKPTSWQSKVGIRRKTKTQPLTSKEQAAAVFSMLYQDFDISTITEDEVDATLMAWVISSVKGKLDES